MINQKKSVTISLPQELSKKLKVYQQKQAILSSEDAIVSVLKAFFERADDNSSYAPLDRLIQLEAQVDCLSEQMANLQKFVTPSVAKPPVLFDRHHSEQKAIEPVPGDYSYEELEDEPDEILYEFLEQESSS